LQTLDVGGVFLIVAFVVTAMILDLFIGSAKWALIAPIFVPMFLILGFSPELTQAAIAASATA
jgi:aminobenzoyl-glutamate transport protein